MSQKIISHIFSKIKKAISEVPASPEPWFPAKKFTKLTINNIVFGNLILFRMQQHGGKAPESYLEPSGTSTIELYFTNTFKECIISVMRKSL